MTDSALPPASAPPARPVERIHLVLPAYNEASGLGELLSLAVKALDETGLPFEIVVVDDGSADETAAIAERAGADDPRVRLVRHPRNRGLGPAILTGLSDAVDRHPGEGTLAVCMDADLTHSPSYVPAMIDAANGGADLVIASRFQPGSVVVGVSAFRRLLSWGARKVFARFLGLEGIRDYTCGFRAIRASLVQRGFDRFGRDGLIVRRGFACTDELLVKLVLADAVVREIPFELRYDHKRGASKIRLWVTILETIRLARWARTELARKRREDGR